jgi:hypothetical protein
MHTAAATWNFVPADNSRLTELMNLFGCVDVIAPVDADAFCKRAGDVIWRGATLPKVAVQTADKVAVQTAEKPIREDEKSTLQSNLLEVRSISERTSLLNVLHNAPRSDRLIMLAAAAGSISLLIGAAAVLSDS